jgi:hypothetical protein
VSLSEEPRQDAGPRNGVADAKATEAGLATGPTSTSASPVQRHFAEVAHAVHGRVRLRFPGAKRDPALLDQFKTTISEIQGVDAVDVKAGSGSLVIYYDYEHHPEVAALLRCLTQIEHAPMMVKSPPVPPPPNRVDELTRNIENEAEFLAEHSAIAKTVVGAMKQLDKDIKRSTNNNLDLKIMVPVALAGVTFLEIGAAAATPMWITLAIFSLNHFVELHAHDADEDSA